jgi:hypothetical protein
VKVAGRPCAARLPVAPSLCKICCFLFLPPAVAAALIVSSLGHRYCPVVVA